MTRTLLIALIASVPLSLLAWLAAWAVERLGAGLALRLRAWMAALLLPALLAPAMLAIHAAGVRSPFPEPRQPSAAVAPAAPSEAVILIAPLPAPTPSPPAPPPVVLILLGVLAAGATLRLGALALALRRIARIAANSEEIADPALAGRLGAGVRQADTASPVLAGLIRPVILMPRRLIASLPPEQAVMVCAHERAHLAAGDHLSHLMEETLVRLFWFNPFLAAARKRLAAAREEACDARALQGCDEAHRRAYARTLICALRMAGEAEPVAAFTGFRRRGAERRLRAILRPSGPGSLRSILAATAAGLGLVAAAGGLSLAVAAEPPDPPAPPAPAAIAARPIPPPPPTALGPVSVPVPPAPPRPDGRPHNVVVIRKVMEDGKTATVDVSDGKDGWVQTFVYAPGSGPGPGPGMGGFDPDQVPGLTPEDRARIKKDMEDARVAMARAMADSHRAMEEAHKQVAQAHMMTEEQRAKLHKDIEDAMKKARVEMAQNDGRVLMSCKLGADGKAQDCRKVDRPVRFQLYRYGSPEGGVPPWPPMPPMPAPPPPPPPPG